MNINDIEWIEKRSIFGYLYEIPNSFNDFIKLNKDITLYKAVRSKVIDRQLIILELFIPKGSTLYYFNLNSKNIDDRKVRVSCACPVGGFYLYKDEYKTTFKEKLYSDHDPDYLYKIGTLQKPKKAFSRFYESCESGIHGFFDVKDAIRWAEEIT